LTLITEQVLVPTAAGAMNTLVARPVDGPPCPIVVFFMDAHGRRPELDTMARRLAADGYCVLQPDLYHREETLFALDLADPASLARVQGLITATTTENVRADFGALLRWADGVGIAAGGAVGCVGYCFSGPFALDIANEHAGRVRAAASIHGVRLHTDRPDSPHRNLAAGRAELYVGVAEHDDYAPAEMIDRLAAALAESGVPHRVEVYPGTGHGFVFPERDTYDEAAAERHWERLLDLFRRTLQR